MHISRLYHITQEGLSDRNELEQIRAYCEGGGRCTQLRMKTKTKEEMMALATAARVLTAEYGTQLIINDHLEIAKEVRADGVHLGQEDRSTEEARMLLGDEVIIGRTCNTLEQIIEAAESPIDYVGVGPFRFTATKDKLSPVLGLAGYKEISEALKKLNLEIPVIAIGGIQVSDISDLRNVGVYGIAVASLINLDEHPDARVKEIISYL